eukprot:COSAG03_NODE_163_length_11308_cov_5.701044_11_plen_210_part_00
MGPLGGSSGPRYPFSKTALPLVLDEDDALCAALACTTLRDLVFAQARHVVRAAERRLAQKACRRDSVTAIGSGGARLINALLIAGYRVAASHDVATSRSMDACCLSATRRDLIQCVFVGLMAWQARRSYGSRSGEYHQQSICAPCLNKALSSQLANPALDWSFHSNESVPATSRGVVRLRSCHHAVFRQILHRRDNGGVHDTSNRHGRS